MAIERITYPLICADPQMALAMLQAVVETGDVALWKKTVSPHTSIDHLRDESGRNLMHMLAASPKANIAMAEMLIEHVKADGGNVRLFLSALDNQGNTPRDLGEIGAVLYSQGAVTGKHYRSAAETTGDIVFVDEKGTTTTAGLSDVSKQPSWAREVVRNHLFLDLAGVEAQLPELSTAFVKRGGKHIVRQETSQEFVGQAKVQGVYLEQSLVINYSTQNYLRHDPSRNVAAHEMTHIADAHTTFVNTPNGVEPSFGRYSNNRLFKLVRELDAILDGDLGVTGRNKAVVENAEAYTGRHDVEYFARASDAIGGPLQVSESRMLHNYRKIILSHALCAQAYGGEVALVYLDMALSSARPEDGLPRKVQDNLETYRFAATEISRAGGDTTWHGDDLDFARRALVADKHLIYGAMRRFMEDTVSQASDAQLNQPIVVAHKLGPKPASSTAHK